MDTKALTKMILSLAEENVAIKKIEFSAIVPADQAAIQQWASGYNIPTGAGESEANFTRSSLAPNRMPMLPGIPAIDPDPFLTVAISQLSGQIRRTIALSQGLGSKRQATGALQNVEATMEMTWATEITRSYELAAKLLKESRTRRR